MALAARTGGGGVGGSCSGRWLSAPVAQREVWLQRVLHRVPCVAYGGAAFRRQRRRADGQQREDDAEQRHEEDETGEREAHALPGLLEGGPPAPHLVQHRLRLAANEKSHCSQSGCKKNRNIGSGNNIISQQTQNAHHRRRYSRLVVHVVLVEQLVDTVREGLLLETQKLDLLAHLCAHTLLEPERDAHSPNCSVETNSSPPPPSSLQFCLCVKVQE